MSSEPLPTGVVPVMQELAASLNRACQAVVQSDLERLKFETGRQRNLTLGLATLIDSVKPISKAAEVGNVDQVAFGGREGNSWSEQLRELEGRVQTLNRDYAILLRRARRTVDIFCRLLNDSSVVYSPPTRTAARGDRGRGQACPVL